MRPDDIVTLLLRDHHNIDRQFEAFATADRGEWGARFSKLADSIVRHEAAEEMILYPVLRMEPGGAAIADARLGEQSEVAGLISQMEAMDATSGEFAEAFDILRGAVIEHATAEETFVFPVLQEGGQESLLAEMGRRYDELHESVPASLYESAKSIAERIRQAAPNMRRRSVSPRRATGGDEQEPSRHRVSQTLPN